MRYDHSTYDVNLGIPAVDRDHRQLIDLMIRLQAQNWGASGPALIRATVDDLDHHLTHHFRREEMLMRLVGYPDAPRHQRSHVGLAVRLGEFQSMLRRNDFPHWRFHDFVTGPLLSHLLDEDADLKPWTDRLREPKAA